MKNQRGMADGWMLLLGVIVVLVLVSGIVYGVTSYLDGVDAKGYQRGKEETEANYAQRDNEALQEALGRVKQLQEAARAKEQAHGVELARIDRERQQEAANARKQAERDRAAARDGSLKLRDPGRTAGAPDCRGGTGPAPGAPAGERDGKAGTDLSPEASGFLLDLVNEADDVARQLADAQQVILAQQKTCNGGTVGPVN